MHGISGDTLDSERLIKKTLEETDADLVGITRLNEESIIILAYAGSGRCDLKGLDKKAERAAEKIRCKGFNARVVNANNGEGISLRKLAEEAGLGFIGRSGLLIAERFGPDVRLSGIITNIDLRPEKKSEAESGCDGCRRCEDSCPAGAIVEKGVDKCRRHVENSGMERCTVCIDVCPFKEEW